MRLDIQEGSEYPIGLHFGRILGVSKLREHYFCFRWLRFVVFGAVGKYDSVNWSTRWTAYRIKRHVHVGDEVRGPIHH